MSTKAKWQITVSVFVVCWVLYFLIPCVKGRQCLAEISNLFESDAVNLIFLMTLFLTLSVLAADAAEFFFLRLRRLPWFRPRLGEILVTRGFITESELCCALEEQRLRIGELLAKYGRVSTIELDQAADLQRSREGLRFGEALLELGYVSSHDVSWALERRNRKLGKILVEQGLINEYDLRRTLGRMWYGRNFGL
ncbi:MAG: hypothetical protein PVG78_08110 [Desulfobacterales bacterium]